jgi:hypothetical protein
VAHCVCPCLFERMGGQCGSMSMIVNGGMRYNPTQAACPTCCTWWVHAQALLCMASKQGRSWLCVYLLHAACCGQWPWAVPVVRNTCACWPLCLCFLAP